MVRGGSWHGTGDGWRSASRRSYEPRYRGISIGLRLVREVEWAFYTGGSRRPASHLITFSLAVKGDRNLRGDPDRSPLSNLLGQHTLARIEHFGTCFCFFLAACVVRNLPVSSDSGSSEFLEDSVANKVIRKLWDLS
ncbi:hypothetical protein SAMN05518854_11430 [Variovorax sp. YR266]|nr:hypothetical protein [Variovorax sp. YR266]SDZ70388.1 hypothetical protein SAMN05518854_11430 [Variovorax sp. YR266]